MTRALGPVQFFLKPRVQSVFGGKQHGHMPARHLVPGIPVHTFRPGIPSHHLSFEVQQEEGVVPDPWRNLKAGIVLQNQQMARRQHMRPGRVVHFPPAVTRTGQSEPSLRLRFLQNVVPQGRNSRFEGGHDQFIQTAPDDFFPRESEQLTSAETGLAANALVIQNEQRCHGTVEDRMQ